MTYVLGAVLGAVLGGAAGYIKNRLIWVKYMNREADPTGEASALYTRMLASNMANIAILAAAFFLRNLQPFSVAAFLIGTGVSLVLVNRAILLGQKKNFDNK